MITAIVTTTIYVPKLLEAYAADAKKFQHDCFFVVVADKKTPPEAETFCAGLEAKMHYFNLERQATYLKKYPELNEHLTWNSIQRRNIGILFAYEQGADQIITIDDDNFLVDEDFIGKHTVGENKNLDVITSQTGWLNVCDFLKEEHDRRFYHRGFAPEKRFLDEQPVTQKKSVRVVVNAGLWLEDPDIDALTRLYFPNQPINALEYTRAENFALAPHTWSPFNSQNTALHRDVIPAYFLSPYVGRYDDIWGSYVLKRIADQLGDAITFGAPIVRQARNPHNYWKDLEAESMGMILTEKFTNILRSIELTGKNYGDCYKELTEKLEENVRKENWQELERRYLSGYLLGMRVWLKTLERLGP
jgi:hypothetical protein